MGKEINCKRIKERIFLYADGNLNRSEFEDIKEHIEKCRFCTVRFEQYKKIKSALSVDFKEPDYLEGKIMAAVRQSAQEKAKKPASIFKTRILAYGTSFAAVFAAVFLIYSTSSQGPVFETADTGKSGVIVQESIEKGEVQKAVVVADSPKDTVEKAKADERIDIKPETALDVPEKDVPVYVYSPSKKTEKAPETAAKQSPETSSGESVMFYAAKTGETPGITPRLEEEKAVVANNLVDPRSGVPAIIRVKVDEPELVRVVIYDKNVRTVKSIMNENKEPGVYEMPWYGKNDNNEIVREGVYFVMIQIGRRVIKKNII
ncbi:MAG TPA: hypothetical protein ENN55_02370, partial [Firmicutes bacterium]|nr:hypothetical protein [Bacillota bacterium]